jgi:hypothetical protein
MAVRVDITTVTSSSFHVSWDEYTELVHGARSRGDVAWCKHKRMVGHGS